MSHLIALICLGGLILGSMDILDNYHRKLFPYAYNILGSAAEARDAIQDVIVKHISTPGKEMDNEMGYLTMVIPL